MLRVRAFSIWESLTGTTRGSWVEQTRINLCMGTHDNTCIGPAIICVRRLATIHVMQPTALALTARIRDLFQMIWMSLRIPELHRLSVFETQVCLVQWDMIHVLHLPTDKSTPPPAHRSFQDALVRQTHHHVQVEPKYRSLATTCQQRSEGGLLIESLLGSIFNGAGKTR